jgi:hypothetical protein
MKIRVAFATAALGAAALLGLTACGGTDLTDSLTPEATALTAVGFSEPELAPDDPTPAPSSSAAGSASAAAKPHKGRRPVLRRELARHVEHGEVVVQTKEGDKTVDVQRGTVTAITSTSVTVKSADGFTQTWAFGSPLKVVEHRATVQPSEVKTGIQIGVAGVKKGSTVTANLIVIPEAK